MSFALKGPFGIKQCKLSVIVTASLITGLLPHIFKPSPLYPFLFRALCFPGFPAGQEGNRLPTGGTESLGDPWGCAPLMNAACAFVRVYCICLWYCEFV